MEGFQADAYQTDAFQLLSVAPTLASAPAVRGWVLPRGLAPWRRAAAPVRLRVR